MANYANSKCRITGETCPAWSEVAGCGLVCCKFVEKGGGGGERLFGDSKQTDSDKPKSADPGGNQKFAEIGNEEGKLPLKNV